MLPSGRYMLRTNPLMTPFILLNGIMLCRYDGPRSMMSSTMWTHRCTMMSKNAGGKYISSSHSMTTISSCSLVSCFELIDFQEITSKKITETSKRVTDVLVHYPSKGNRYYLRHHHVTVMRLHPAEPFS